VGLAKVAAGCMRSLLMTHPKTACEEYIGRNLWGRLIPFICDIEAEDPESVKTPLTQALVASVVTIGAMGRFAAMSILVPVLLLRATQVPTGTNLEAVRRESAVRLLELVAADQVAFKTTVGLLYDEQRSDLEGLLRATGIGKREDSTEAENVEAKPAIQLRMDFG